MSMHLRGATGKTFRFDARKRKAAQLLAEGVKSTQAIADEIGVTRQALWDWRQVREFQDEVERIDKQLDADLYQKGLAKQRNRIAKLDETAEWLEGQLRSTKDPALVREYRAYLRQIAEERGQIGPNRRDDRIPEEEQPIRVTHVQFVHTREVPIDPSVRPNTQAEQDPNDDDGEGVEARESILAGIRAREEEQDANLRAVNQQMREARDQDQEDYETISG